MSPRATFQDDELADVKPTPATSKVEATTTTPTATTPVVDNDDVDDPARVHPPVTKEKIMTELTIEQREESACAVCHEPIYKSPDCHGWYCACVNPDDSCPKCSGVTNVDFAKPERTEQFSGLRTRLERGGYKSIWQTETLNIVGDRTVVSSWVPVELPTDRVTPKAYKASIYEDVLLVERYEGVDGIYPGEYCGSSTYIHGVEPKLAGRKIPLDDIEDDDAHERAAQAVEETGE